MAGNVGRPLTGLDGALGEEPGSCASSRASSWRTSTPSDRASPILLNLAPDHLDRHGTFEDYRAAKLRIFENQTAEDVAVVPRGFGTIPGEARRIEFSLEDELPAEPSIPGEHNRENAAAATAAARAAGIADDAIAAALSAFAGVPHRLELVREVGGVRFVNDSKATNPEAAERALSAYPPGIRLILGGSRKGIPFARLAKRAAASGVAQAYLIGDSADEIAEALAAERSPLHVLARPAERRPGRVPRRRAGGGRPPLARVRELRPVPRLRGAGRALPRARRGAVKRPGGSHLEYHLLVLVTLGLVAFGLVMVYSASSARALLSADAPSYYLKRQAIYAVMGLVALVILSRFDFHRLRHATQPLLAVTFVLLVAVLAIGTAVNGARRWIPIGFMNFQPSELAKLVLALWTAALLARRPAPRTLGELAKPIGVVVGLACALILDRARPRHGDRDRDHGLGDPRRLRHAASAPRLGGRDRDQRRSARHLARAVPPRAHLQLPRSRGTTRRAPASSPCSR